MLHNRHMSGAVRQRIVVRGRVQGVGFRQGTQSQAEELGLSGYVRNCRDGSVEAEVEGPKEAVLTMVAWLRHGPRTAAVTSIEAEQVAVKTSSGFTVEA
jgi:acylphosphatase